MKFCLLMYSWCFNEGETKRNFTKNYGPKRFQSFSSRKFYLAPLNYRVYHIHNSQLRDVPNMFFVVRKKYTCSARLRVSLYQIKVTTLTLASLVYLVNYCMKVVIFTQFTLSGYNFNIIRFFFFLFFWLYHIKFAITRELEKKRHGKENSLIWRLLYFLFLIILSDKRIKLVFDGNRGINY